MTQLQFDGPVAPGCPVSSIGADYQPFEHDTLYAFMQRARREQPVFYCAEIGYWVVTRHADVLAIFRDPDRFSAAIALTPVKPLSAAVLGFLRDNGYGAEATQVSCDRPKHTRIRDFAMQVLNAREYAALEPAIRRIVARSCDALAGRERVDLIADFAYELPALVIFLLLGIPDEDAPRIKQWADNRLLFTFGELDEAGQMNAAAQMLDYWKYCVALVEARKQAPGNDYASRLLAMRNGDDARLTLNEIASLVFGLLLAGHETTTNMTGNAVRALLAHRTEWEKICRDPSLIPGAVEECLRYESSVVCWRRRTLVDVVIGQTSIPAGSNVLLATGSANRDEARFPDGERFDITRPNAREHVSFGNGIHFCLGAALARLELRVILEELARRWPGMRLVDEPLEIVRTLAFRGPLRLPVELDPAQALAGQATR
jgi:hypothetical protein